MAVKGAKFTEEHRKKLSMAKKLNPVRYWSGKKFSDEHKEKLSKTRLLKDFSGEKHPNWKGGTSNICPICGGIKASSPAKMCKTCWLKDETRVDRLRGERINTRGKNNHNWKGGLRGENYIQRRRFRSMFQKQIFERDNYTCQMCGIHGVDLQVDHIQSWAEYVDLRFNINNCRTLCKKCHYFITFGKEMVNKNMPWGHNLERRVSL